MRRPISRLLLSLLAAVVLACGIGLGVVAQPATAAANPSFKVTCYPRGMAQNDPIVFPGQAGRSHMHSFFGAKGVDQNTTADSLLRQSSSQCGAGFDTVDLSAYWIPTLYKDDRPVHDESGAHQLAVYYQRAGGPAGAPVAQAIPRGLKIIAGDMRATTPQPNVSYVCAKTDDAGQQRGGDPEFLTCGPDELFVAKLVFPDCWDGRNLDSADHKSHMAFSGGARATCPASHPVKLPQITFEAWYNGVNGPASSFRWASGGAYTFHGDVISAWDTRAAANLVNQCINVAVDCNPLPYASVPQGPVSQSQIDVQLAGVASAPPSTPSSPASGDSHADHDAAGATPSAPPAPTPSTTPSPDALPSTAPSPGHHHPAGQTTTQTPIPASDDAGPRAAETLSPVAWSAAFVGAILGIVAVWTFARRMIPRRRR